MMGKIGCGYGSEWHLLRNLGRHRQLLSNQVLEITGGQSVSWLDFGFSSKYVKMNNDRELVGLEFIKDPKVQNRWKQFWPQSGTAQNWDAVGQIDFGDHKEWLLVEAKAHFLELKSDCGATAQRSIEKINSALEKSIKSFCIQPTPISKWLSPYYQYANRLAALHFLLQECEPAIPSHLLFIYFYGDHRSDTECPQTKEDWHEVVGDMENWLSLDQNSPLINKVQHLFLPINPNQ